MIVTSTISDHLLQVLFIPSMLSDNPTTRSSIFERSSKNFSQPEFPIDYFDKVHQQYKHYRNLLSTLRKKSKQNYYERFFKNNLNNLKNIWKSIRSLIAIKHSSASHTDMLTHKGATVNDPLCIANIFNDYFSSIAEKSKANIKF